MKQLQQIGTIEHISLPDYGAENVPAKIDTGAISSAIWASNIVMHDGVLTFNLFAPGSMYYCAEPITTSAFRSATVRSSFGERQFRYKVRLTVRIGAKKITRWFTLADRSHNNYPVLLGKNFLKNTFMVDVAHKNLVSKPASELSVLIFNEEKTETARFFNEVAQHNTAPVKYDIVSYCDLYFYIDGQSTTVTNTLNNTDIARYNFTYFKNHKLRELSASAAQYLRYKNRPFADLEFLQYMSASKLSEYMRLSCFDIRVPATITTSTAHMLEQYDDIVEKLGTPFVLKEIKSDKGRFNYLINSQSEFNEMLGLALDGHIYCAQKYIPNDGYYRINILSHEVGMGVWRATTPHKDPLKSHLNKPKGGANAVNVPIDNIPPEAQELALRAADCMNRQVCGVDVVQNNQTKLWYVLEANNDPQIRTGSFIEDKVKMVAKYFEKELNQ